MKSSFLAGIITGVMFSVSIVVLIILATNSLDIVDTTIGRLLTPATVQQDNPLQAILQQAADKAASEIGQCPRSDEFLTIMTLYKNSLNDDFDPSRARANNISNIWRRFNPDSLIMPEGYIGYDNMAVIYKQCTGMAAPVIETRLEDNYLRRTCHKYGSDGVTETKIVTYHRDHNSFDICD